MTDFYAECETGAMVLLRTLTAHFKHDWQVSSDDTVLAKGEDYFVIVRPGAFPLERMTEQLARVGWNIVLDLHVRYKDYKTSWSKFKTFRSDIFNLLMNHPTLNDTSGVLRVDVTGEEQAQYLKFSDVANAQPAFIIQTVRAVVYQYIHYTDGEF